MVFEDMIAEIDHLSNDQRVTLITLLAESLADEHKTYDWTEFEGIAAHLADGTDAQAYINRLRDEWDERP
jgi:hypothetical protein